MCLGGFWRGASQPGGNYGWERLPPPRSRLRETAVAAMGARPGLVGDAGAGGVPRGGWWLREAAPRIPAGPATPEPRAGHSLPPLLLAWTGPEVLLLQGCPHSGPESRVQTACPSALPSPWDHHCPTSQGGTGLWSGPAPLAGKWELGPCGQPLAGWPPGWSPPSPGPGTPLASECHAEWLRPSGSGEWHLGRRQRLTASERR